MLFSNGCCAICSNLINNQAQQLNSVCHSIITSNNYRVSNNVPTCKRNSIFHSEFVDVVVECIIDTLFMDKEQDKGLLKIVEITD